MANERSFGQELVGEAALDLYRKGRKALITAGFVAGGPAGATAVFVALNAKAIGEGLGKAIDKIDDLLSGSGNQK